MHTTGVQKLISFFKYLPGRPRIVLLASELAWDRGERPSTPRLFLDALASLDADIYQIRDLVIVSSVACIRRIHPWDANRHLDLERVEITLEDAFHLIRRNSDNLQDLALSLSSGGSRSTVDLIDLPSLARLGLSCGRYPTDAEKESSRRMLEDFFKVVTMPSLEECSIELSPCAIGACTTLPKSLGSSPKLRSLHFTFSIVTLFDTDEDSLRAACNLIRDMKALGVKTTLTIYSVSIRPRDPTVECLFEEWLPWYSTLGSIVTKLDLTFEALNPDDHFPPDLTLHNCLEFPLLESLSLDIRETKSKFFQASRICSKIRAPRLRHLEVNVLEIEGVPLLYAVLAIVPDQSSLETFRVNAPDKSLADMNDDCKAMCQKRDIAYVYQQWV